jgi:hypothetical protein
VVDQELEARFAELAPWQSRFTIDGTEYGGGYAFEDDGRVDAFFAAVGEPSTVLELGSLEGGHSVQIAQRPFVERLICAEGREENVRRARFIVDLLGLGNVDVRCIDVEAVDLSSLGHFEATFCAGLLYHLMEPWLFMRRLREVTDRAFVDTHYSSTSYISFGGYEGRMYRELGLEDVFSGLRAVSFWPTLPELRRMTGEAGFTIERIEDHTDWPNGPRAWLSCR